MIVRRDENEALTFDNTSKREVLQILKIALAHYTAAYKGKWSISKLRKAGMSDGLCGYLYFQLNFDIFDLMSEVLEEHWMRTSDSRRGNWGICYLWYTPNEVETKADRLEALRRRIIFLKEFIKEYRKA